MEFLVVIVVLILDRITKLWALNILTKVPEIVILKNIFGFSYLENRGAAFGILQNRVILLVVITFIVIAGVIYYFLRYKPNSRILKISIALILGGAVGNLFDRIFYGYVVDFILVHYRDIYYFPTFNVADVTVVIGTSLLAFYLIKEDGYGN
ncbi:signal peptidase II [Clostridium fermenticellae]|uniref:Lipoprotein signal peptidase n=1 Tax=Clostridium fermenticellae TaxID=2068654 RepID=A0A386H4E5_9CLOT|nr:signal peptidase II [Clostridium fermenticellae]AYD40621.1 signal peptidase II [Clostridium fermenticellae]